jgi:hypothetical protein
LRIVTDGCFEAEGKFSQSKNEVHSQKIFSEHKLATFDYFTGELHFCGFFFAAQKRKNPPLHDCANPDCR